MLIRPHGRDQKSPSEAKNEILVESYSNCYIRHDIIRIGNGDACITTDCFIDFEGKDLSSAIFICNFVERSQKKQLKLIRIAYGLILTRLFVLVPFSA